LSVKCEGVTVDEDTGTVIEKLTLSCNNAHQRMGMRVHTWPFDDDNTGSTTIEVKGNNAKKWNTNKCQKALKNMFKESNVIKCDPVTETPDCTCQADEMKLITDKVNKANSDKHQLTASCVPSKKNKKKKKRNKSEVWQMHCDLNENGAVDDDELVTKVKVINKKGSCKVKNAPTIKCQKKLNKCFCMDIADNIVNDFADFASGVVPVVTCLEGSEKKDTFMVGAMNKVTGEVCAGKEITVNTNVCDRKLRSIVKTALKKANC